MEATSIQPPARLMSTPLIPTPHLRLRLDFRNLGWRESREQDADARWSLSRWLARFLFCFGRGSGYCATTLTVDPLAGRPGLPSGWQAR
jgi:hypothetical protein